jgi:hypothetical protein|tara:strand:- start:42 stop:530 length:489 start_codon:yes stop_codon:yes gene_type:complete
MAIIKPNNNTLSSITALPTGLVSGTIEQVVQKVSGFSGGTDLESTSFVSTYLTETITPSSTSSKILINYMWEHKFNATSEGYGTAIHRAISGGSSGNISETEQNQYNYLQGFSSETRFYPSLQYVDSPSTTSAITYTIYIKGHTTSRIEWQPKRIILIEIGG